MAPGNAATLAELRDVRLRPPALTEEVLLGVTGFVPTEPLELGFLPFVQVLRKSARGSSGGPGGMTNEHLKVALDDEDVASLLHRAGFHLAT